MCLSVFKSEAFRARVRARERERARNRDKQSERGPRGRESGTEGGRGEKGRGVHVLYDILKCMPLREFPDQGHQRYLVFKTFPEKSSFKTSQLQKQFILTSARPFNMVFLPVLRLESSHQQYVIL